MIVMQYLFNINEQTSMHASFKINLHLIEHINVLVHVGTQMNRAHISCFIHTGLV